MTLWQTQDGEFSMKLINKMHFKTILTSYGTNKNSNKNKKNKLTCKICVYWCKTIMWNITWNGTNFVQSLEIINLIKTYILMIVLVYLLSI